jgi:hypothetical protein
LKALGYALIPWAILAFVLLLSAHYARTGWLFSAWDLTNLTK